MYRIVNLLTDAVSIQTKFKNVTQSDMEDRIKYHLAQAPFNIKRNEKIDDKTLID